MTERISTWSVNLLFSNRKIRVSLGRKYFLKDVNFFAHSGSVLSTLIIISHHFYKTVLFKALKIQF